MSQIVQYAPPVRFREGLLKARGHIVFLLALLTGFGLILSFGDLAAGHDASADPSSALAAENPRLELPQPQPLTAAQKEWGRIAWRYFVANTPAETGLTNSANKFPSTTMWDEGSSLLALIAAERLAVISRSEFDRRTAQALASLASLQLFDGALPNKAYNTQTLAMVDYNNAPSTRGIGWSSLDIARLLVPLGILSRDYPNHAAAVRRVVDRWDFGRLANQGMMFGASVVNGQTAIHQEGRVGYEEYAAKSFIRAGVDAFEAWRTDDTLTLRKVSGVKVPVDGRHHDDWGAQVVTTSEPYILDGLEFGFDTRSRVLAEQVYRAEAKRYADTGILTAVSEGHVDRAPNFVYASVFANGQAWAVINDKGKRFDELRTLSTKTAFALDALYRLDYTHRLTAAVASLNDPAGAWLDGRYETSGRPNNIQTANTNAIVLESLHYRVMGPLVSRGPA